VRAWTDSDWAMFVHKRVLKEGQVEFKCRKGFWSVSGSQDDEDRVRKEAQYYFAQYWFDGEYA